MIDLKQGDCLELMKDIPDESIDMILADLPYGTTDNKWDTIIDFNKLWEQYNRITKSNAAIVLFGTEPFSSLLRLSNPKMYRYDWIWNKKKAGNIFLAKKQPMKIHENISVFGKKSPKYYPIKTPRKNIKMSKNYGTGKNFSNYVTSGNKVYKYKDKYPVSIQEFSNANQKGKVHPTQKPVKLLEYLIKTYTNEGELVLDNTMGSGSTGVAAVNLNRNFIGYELEQDYFDIATNRINEAIKDRK